MKMILNIQINENEIQEIQEFLNIQTDNDIDVTDFKIAVIKKIKQDYATFDDFFKDVIVLQKSTIEF